MMWGKGFWDFIVYICKESESEVPDKIIISSHIHH